MDSLIQIPEVAIWIESNVHFCFKILGGINILITSFPQENNFLLLYKFHILF